MLPRVLLTFLLIFVIAGAIASSVDMAAQEDPDFTIELRDIFFEPNELIIPADTDVRILLDNTGAAEHSFVSEELGINELVDPGASRVITVNIRAGEYEVICDVPGHQEAGMEMTLTAEHGATIPTFRTPTPTFTPSPTSTPIPRPPEEPLIGTLAADLQVYRHVNAGYPDLLDGFPDWVVFNGCEFGTAEQAASAIMVDLENRMRVWEWMGYRTSDIRPTSARDIGDATLVLSGYRQDPDYDFDDDWTVVLAYVRIDRFLLIALATGEGLVPLVGTLDLIESHITSLPVDITIDDLLPSLEVMPEGYQPG
ncbi:MAG: cupredoxin domain-containing protein [Thermomicrobiales bacterium]